MDEASKDLGKKIKSEQTTFDAVYARLDTEKDISQIALDPRDVEDLKEELKLEFGKDFSDADIEKADKQFCDYDNADPSTRRKMRNMKGTSKSVMSMKEKAAKSLNADITMSMMSMKGNARCSLEKFYICLQMW